MPASQAFHQFGDSSNSLFALYPKVSWFNWPNPTDPCIAYHRTSKAWVAVAEPLIHPERRLEAYIAFGREALSQGYVCAALPVGESLARQASEAGLGALKIGHEPGFDLKTYRPNIDGVRGARSAQALGCRVSEIRPEHLLPAEMTELNDLRKSWLESRKSAALSFVNVVAPWEARSHKRYFVVKLAGRIEVFLSALPYRSGTAWYLADVLRVNEAPTGTTELGIIETLRLLQESGAVEASLGVAPLSLMREAPVLGPKRIVDAMDWVYHHGDFFYNFRPLHKFKQKFRPSFERPAFLICSPGPIGLQVTRGIFRVFMPKGFVRATLLGAIRQHSFLALSEWIAKRCKTDLVLRDAPRGLDGLWKRAPFSAVIGVILVFAFALSSRLSLYIRPRSVERYRFAWEAMRSGRGVLQRVLMHPFLHWNVAHLLANLFLIVLFVLPLEILTSTGIAMTCFFIAAWTANIILEVLVFLPWMHFRPEDQAILVSASDLGASLGIFGCLGALLCSFRGGLKVAGGLATLLLGVAWFERDPMQMNHIVALAIGWLTFRVWKRSL